MRISKAVALLAVLGGAAACTETVNKTRDAHFGDSGSSDLSQMTAGIWVDPQGCEHWLIDDGLEGYADPRRTPDGMPVCNSDLPLNTVTGPFKSGSSFEDFL